MQAHVSVPSLYINIDRGQESDADEPKSPAKQADEHSKKDEIKTLCTPRKIGTTDRFRIIRLEAKGDKRVVGEIKIAVYGKISQDAKFVPTTTQPMSGGWVKVTPTESLPNGEYAVVEMLGKEGMNLYVWDFGVNPNAPRIPSPSSRTRRRRRSQISRLSCRREKQK